MGSEFSGEELSMLHSAVRSKIHHWNEESSRGAVGGDPFALEAHNRYLELAEKVARMYQRQVRAQGKPTGFGPAKMEELDPEPPDIDHY